MLKSPIYLAGNKFKLLPQILPLLPKRFETFVDLFGGSGTVLMNVDATYYIYNEKNARLFELFLALDNPNLLEGIQYFISTFGLDDNNEKAYQIFRHDYNIQPNPIKLFTLICHSFSNMMRFNKKKEFNAPFGKRTLNANAIQNIAEAFDFMSRKEVKSLSYDFEDVCFPSSSFVYCDPPYFGSNAVYNEGSGWLEQDETRLRDYLERLDCPWALSNELGKNPTLREWAEDNHFTVHGLNFDYSSCNYQRKPQKTEEVLILSRNT